MSFTTLWTTGAVAQGLLRQAALDPVQFDPAPTVRTETPLRPRPDDTIDGIEGDTASSLIEDDVVRQWEPVRPADRMPGSRHPTAVVWPKCRGPEPVQRDGSGQQRDEDEPGRRGVMPEKLSRRGFLVDQYTHHEHPSACRGLLVEPPGKTSTRRCSVYIGLGTLILVIIVLVIVL